MKEAEILNWKPITAQAPKDGAVVWLRNEIMDRAVHGRWTEYTSNYGTKSMQWVLVRDFDQFMPMPPGTLIVPSEWAPIEGTKP